MKCNGFKNLLPLELEGQLKGKLKENFHAHLKSCPYCGQEFEMVRTAEKYLSSMQLNVPKLSDTFEEKVIEKINTSPADGYFYYCSLGFLALTFASFFIACGLLLFPATGGFSFSIFESLYGLVIGLISLTNFPLSNIVLAVCGILTWCIAIAYVVNIYKNTIKVRS
jgi:hypothetical protein